MGQHIFDLADPAKPVYCGYTDDEATSAVEITGLAAAAGIIAPRGAVPPETPWADVSLVNGAIEVAPASTRRQRLHPERQERVERVILKLAEQIDATHQSFDPQTRAILKDIQDSGV